MAPVDRASSYQRMSEQVQPLLNPVDQEVLVDLDCLEFPFLRELRLILVFRHFLDFRLFLVFL